jgi:peptidoglycan/xylan/chitin deacetylase (PgdA/CDA1 family)
VGSPVTTKQIVQEIGEPEPVGARVERSCVFTYHEILPTDSAYLYRVTTSSFENHLSLIRSVLIKNVLNYAAPRFTFDDGHRSNYENAFPILERFGVKVNFFILAGRVGSNADYISWRQAQEIATAGHCVGSHGWSHRMLTQCSSDELERELGGSKCEIEDRLGVQVDSISVPGGRWNERIVDACARAGYRYLFHSNPWLPTNRRSGVTIQGRTMVTRRMDSRRLQKLMQLNGLEREYLRMIYATKESVRLLLGDRLYHMLWCWAADWRAGDGPEVEVDERANINREPKTS